MAFFLAAVSLSYACGDDSTRPSASGDDTSSSGGADSSFHDVASETAVNPGDGAGGDITTDATGDGSSGGSMDATTADTFFEATVPPEDGHKDSPLLGPDGSNMIPGDDGGD